MKAESPAIAELSWPQVHAFRMARHHLLMPAPKRDLVKVVGEIAGVQAQVMSAAELQACVRVSGSTEDVRRALWTERTLVKTWLMRGTLHLLPAVDLPLVFDMVHSPKVSRTAGWISAVVLVDGRVMGTWTHSTSGGRLRVTVAPFRRLSSRVVSRVRARASYLGGALGVSRSEVEIA